MPDGHKLSPDAAYEEARRRIAKAARTDATLLDLHDLALDRLPPELGSLTRLEVLALGSRTPGRARTDEWEWDKETPTKRFADASALAGLTALQHLGLSWCRQLTSVDGLSGLTALRHLDLSRCEQLTSVDFLPGLTALQHLSLGGCGQLTSVDGLSGLTALRHLDLGGCEQLTSVDFLPGLTALQHLSLGGCGQLTSVDGLSGLTALRHLDLDGCEQLTSVDFLPGLTALQHLGLSWCRQLTSVDGLSGLTALRHLDLDGCEQLTSVDGLSWLTALQHLGLSWCRQLTSVDGLSGLTALRHLDLDGCEQLTSVDFLPGLTSLQHLSLRGCGQLTSVDGLSGLTALQHLDLRKCDKIRQFVPLCPLLGQFKGLRLHGCRFEDLDPVLCGDPGENVAEKVRAHFAALEQQAGAVDREGKLILLGNGHAGKTSCAKLLLGRPHDAQENSTHGIRLWTWEPAIELDGDTTAKAVRVNLWDFAGQDLYHNTHRLFLQSRAVFTVLWDAFEPITGIDEDGGYEDLRRPLTYWLDQIHSLHPQPRVLLVRNKTDDDRGRPVPDWRLQVPERYRHLDMLELSCAVRAPEAVRQVTARLHSALREELGPEGQRQLGKGRLAVKEQIRAWQQADAERWQHRQPPQHPVLTQEEFRRLVAERCPGTDDAREPRHLLDYLHHTGVVYHRPGLFADRIILDQRWAIEGIYALFHRQKCWRRLVERHGRFRPTELRDWCWREAGYSDADQELFLSFMESCDIAFQLLRRDEAAGGEPVYLAPSLLPDREAVEPEIAARLERYGGGPLTPALSPAGGEGARRAGEGARATAQHPFLGEEVMLQFLKQAGEWFSRSAVLWKWGALLPAREGRAHILVEWERTGEGFGGRVEVRLFGDVDDTLLERVLCTFSELPSFPREATWQKHGAKVPAPETRPSAPQPLRPTISPKLPEPLEMDPAPPLHRGSGAATLEAERPSRSQAVGTKVGLSVAGKDATHPDIEEAPSWLYREFIQRLAREEVIYYRHYHDGTEAGHPDQSDQRLRATPSLGGLMHELANSDFFVAFIGDKFLVSPYCLNELVLAYQAPPAGEFPKGKTQLFMLPEGTATLFGGQTAGTELTGAWRELVEKFRRQLGELAGPDPLDVPAAMAAEPCHDLYVFLKDHNNRLKLFRVLSDYRYQQPPDPKDANALRAWAAQWAEKICQRMGRWRA